MKAEKVKSILTESVRSGKVFHAYIFEDNKGSEAKELARYFAGALVCKAQDDVPCGTCIDCRKLNNGNHEDVFWISHEGTIKVDDILELQKQLRRKSYGGKHRVAIVDKAESITPAAQNKLLKTLEEPSAGTVIILLAANADSLPLTVVSRCIVHSMNETNSLGELGMNDELDHAHEVLEAITANKPFFIQSKLMEENMATFDTATDFLEKLKLCTREELLTGKLEISIASIIIESAEAAQRDINRKLKTSYVLKNMILSIEMMRKA